MIVRADRADGFVAHNFTVRGALEHGLYVEETDGYRIDTVKMFWAADYGNLTFTSDHGLYTDCDGIGAGDAVLYPGGAPETGEQADKSFYPDAPRFNTTVARLRHARQRARLLGLDGQRVRHHPQQHLRQHRRHLDRHDLGRRAPRLPGRQRPDRPQLDLLEQPGAVQAEPAGRRRRRDPAVRRRIFWAGHNNGGCSATGSGTTGANGACLLSIPDFLVTPEGNINPGGSCNSTTLSTSCGNRFFDNDLGRVPKGFKPFPELYGFGNNVGATRGKAPNGVDFWWDEGGIGSVTGNCWFDERGPDGTPASVTARASGTATTCCRPTARPARARATP